MIENKLNRKNRKILGKKYANMKVFDGEIFFEKTKQKKLVKIHCFS